MGSWLLLAYEPICTEMPLHEDPDACPTGLRRGRAAQRKPLLRVSSASPLVPPLSLSRACNASAMACCCVLLGRGLMHSRRLRVAFCRVGFYFIGLQTNPGCQELHAAAASQPLCGRRNEGQHDCIARTAAPLGAGPSPREWREEHSFGGNISKRTHAQTQGITLQSCIDDGILSYLSITS